MIVIRPTTRPPPALRAELRFNPEAIDRELIAQKNLTFNDFEALQGDLFEVGEPQWWDLAALLREAGVQPDPLVRDRLITLDFWLIMFTLSVLPLHGNRVTWARLRIALSCDDPALRPLVHSLFPRRPSGGAERATVGPDFRFYSDGRPPAEGLPTVLVEPNASVKKLTGSGLNLVALMWDFEGGDVRGDMVTYGVVQKPSGSGLWAEVSFNATLETSKGTLEASAAEAIQGGARFRVGPP